MTRLRWWILTGYFILLLQPLKADQKHLNDTIKTYNIEEVVITSSAKETNNLLKLPGSVSILSPQAIANRQIYSLKDISSFVPNLYIPDYGAKLTSAIYIRGIGARSSGQSIGLYVDNVPYLDKSTFDFELMDIQRIEVLRGPQGTLYGRNAMGGIINIYTLSPLDYQGTKILLTAGNYGTFRAKASHYARLSDNMGISLAGYYDRNDGFFTNQYTDPDNGIYPRKADALQSVGGRMKLDWRMDPSLKASYAFSFDYTDQGGFPYGYYNRATRKIDPVNINDSSFYTRTMLANHLSLEYKNKNILLTSTTGYQYLNDDMKMDQDFSPRSVFTLNQLQKQHAFSEEIAIKNNLPGNYQWSFGLYGFYNELHTDGPVTFKEDGINDILQPVFDAIEGMPFDLKITDKQVYIPGSFDTPSYGGALFHQSTYNNLFTDGLSLTVGGRIDYEKQKMSYRSEAAMNLALYSGNTFLMDLDGDPSVMDTTITQSFWQFLPKVSLKYECTSRTFTYFSIAKGYKTGGYNVQMSADVMQGMMQYDMMKKYMPDKVTELSPLDSVMSYKPENSWNFELGIRSELIKGILDSEVTLFYTNIRDIQITQFVGSGNGRILVNAGKARSMGVEASLRARITNELTADINYGYTNATFRDYIHQYKAKENGTTVFKSVDCKGNYIPYIPRNTVNMGVQYNKLFQNKWVDQFTASAQLSGTGKIVWDELNELPQPFYATLNAKIGARKGIVKIDLWSRNITDTKYSAFYFESFGNPFMQRGKPFQIGADLTLIL